MISVREARPPDAAAMAGAWLDAGRYYAALDATAFRVPDADGLDESFAGQLAVRNDAEVTYVAEIAGEVVGFAGARLVPPDAHARFQLLRDLDVPRVVTEVLVVAERARRRGAGRALMTAVHDWATERGARTAAVETYARSPLSVGFYERLGYQRRSLSYRLALVRP